MWGFLRAIFGITKLYCGLFTEGEKIMSIESKRVVRMKNDEEDDDAEDDGQGETDSDVSRSFLLKFYCFDDQGTKLLNFLFI